MQHAAKDQAPDGVNENNKGDPAMNAIELLESQHRDVEDTFAEIESSDESDSKLRAFEKLADSLAIHAAIEEHQFYPAVKAKGLSDLVLESLEEHLGVKRVIADIMKTDPDDDTFSAKVKVLKELVLTHVDEEESELFPQVQSLFDGDQLDELGAQMESEAGQLYDEGSPRMNIPSETEQAPAL
jgi:hemerythrin superfamily protein